MADAATIEYVERVFRLQANTLDAGATFVGGTGRAANVEYVEALAGQRAIVARNDHSGSRRSTWSMFMPGSGGAIRWRQERHT